MEKDILYFLFDGKYNLLLHEMLSDELLIKIL
jgi:hypothetical protein